MSLLSEILGSHIRAAIFRLLFAGPEAELHVREIQRRTGFNDRALRQELARLATLGLLVSRRDGNRLYYRAHRQHPLYPEIRGLTMKTVGLADALRERLDKAEGIALAFVFGSVARGSEKAHSDVDLMVLGNVTLRELTRILRGAQEELGREINPHILTLDEFRQRATSREHFVSTVLAEERIMVKGTEDELGGLAA